MRTNKAVSIRTRTTYIDVVLVHMPGKLTDVGHVKEVGKFGGVVGIMGCEITNPTLKVDGGQYIGSPKVNFT